MPKSILITGGCGFVGSNLAIGVKEKYPSNSICVIDNLKRRGSELNIVRLKETGITFVHGDIGSKMNMLWHFYQKPKQGEVYNAGGSRHSNYSMIEAIKVCERITGKKMNYKYTEANRQGDHIWRISDISKFRSHFPEWNYKYGLNDIPEQIHQGMTERVA